MLWLLCLVVEASLTGLDDIVASSGGFSSLIPLLYPISHLLFLRNFQYFAANPPVGLRGFLPVVLRDLLPVEMLTASA